MFEYFYDKANDKIKTTSLPNSLPVQLHRDLKSIRENLTLKNSKDLQHLKKIAHDRDTSRL